MKLIERARQRHIELLEEIAEKDRQLIVLRNESGIAREAVDRYCPLCLRDAADRWLRRKGL